MLRKFLTWSCLMLVSTAGIAAQSGAATGEIHGRIMDATGGGLPGATVTVTRRETGWAFTATTSNLGEYSFLLLQPGTYEVLAVANKFRGANAAPVPLAVGQRQRVDLTLEVGTAPAQAIDVTTSLSLAEPDRTYLGSHFDQATLRNFPMDRRDFLAISLISSAVADSEAMADTSDFRVVQAAHSGLSFHGNNGRGTSVSVDGAEANDSGGGIRPSLNQDAVAEFQINRSNYSAEFGGANGGVLNIVSKSGTNLWSGSAYGFLRHQALDAADPFARNFTNGRPERIKPDADRQQVGAAVGGPIRRNQTFVFTSFEGLERDEANSVAVLTTDSIFQPTPQQESILAGLQPADATRLRALLTSSAATRELFAINSGVFPFTTSDYKLSARLDHRAGNNQFFLRYSTADIHESNPNTRALIGVSRSFDTSRLDHTGLLNWTRTISNDTVSQLHYHFNYGTFRVSTAEKFGPQIDIRGFGFFNRDVLLPSNILWRRQEITNRWTLARGAHQLKIGGQLLVRDSNVESHAFLPGRFVFGQLPGGLVDPLLASTAINGLQAFNLKLPQAYQQGFGDPRVSSTDPYFAVFAQDLWRFSNRLTLDFGLRYELDDIRAPIRTDTNNLAPRFGISWDVSGNRKTTMRAAYGIFYAPTSYVLPGTIAQLGENEGVRQIAQVLSTLTSPGPASPAGPINIFQTLTTQGVITLPTPTRSIRESDLSQFGINVSHTGPRPPGTVLFRAADDFASAYTQQTSFGIDHEIAGQWLLSANYLFVREPE